MSWSVSTSGTKAEVRAEVAKQLDSSTPGYCKCGEPEETLRQAAGALALAAIDANPDNNNVGVSCYGSALTDADGVQTSNSVTVSMVAYS